MKALVLAAGFGTRVRPISDFVPKPLFPLLDRPLILWTFETLKDLPIRSAIVNLHYMGEEIREVLGSHQGEIEITYSHEPELLGTGGAIKKIRSQLEAYGNLLVINSDCVFLGSLKGLINSHLQNNSLATLAVKEDAQRLYTPIYADDSGAIVSIGEDELRAAKRLMFLGAHVISAKAIEIFPKEKAFGIVRDAYIPAIKSGQLRIWEYSGAWLDCGTNALYLNASNFLLDNPDLWLGRFAGKIKVPNPGIFMSGESEISSDSALIPPVFIGDGVQVKGSKIGPHVVVGKGSIIKGALLKSGIVWQKTVIQQKSTENFIATPFVTVELGA